MSKGKGKKNIEMKKTWKLKTYFQIFHSQRESFKES